MLKQTSKEFRKLFLLEFTRQLIDAYAPEDIAKLERAAWSVRPLLSWTPKDRFSESVLKKSCIKAVPPFSVLLIPLLLPSKDQYILDGALRQILI